MSEDRGSRMSSVLGETGTVLGNVNGSGDLEVRGRVQGTIHLDGRVLVTESGVVLGGVEAIHITVQGRIQGDLIASDSVLIGAFGRVEGNLSAPRIGIEAGARVRGILRAGEEDEGSVAEARHPAREAILPEARIEREMKAPVKVPMNVPVNVPMNESLNVPLNVPRAAESPRSAELSPPTDKPRDKRRSRRSRKPRSALHSDATQISEPSPAFQAREMAPHSKLRPPKKTQGEDAPPTRNPAPPASAPIASPSKSPAEPQEKGPRRRGPPTMPTFVKGTKGHKRG